MKLEQQLKTALNDNRLLMLGAQVLFGLQFNAVFQEMFESLTSLPRVLASVWLMLLILTIALLITTARGLDHDAQIVILGESVDFGQDRVPGAARHKESSRIR